LPDVILVADSHLRAEDPDLALFLRLLRQVAAPPAQVYLLGDIFDLWIARQGFELPFHRAVVEEIEALRGAGAHISYVQGNRDYFVRERYAAGPFVAVADDALVIEQAGLRIHLAHGDLVNLDDRQYQRWRRFSRSRAVGAAFGALPSGAGLRLSLYLERKFRTTNARYRRGFPEAQAEKYARSAFREGAQIVVLGHFHEARSEEYPADGAPGGRLFVLPGWREDRRYLRIDAAGKVEFVPFA
jgi:UDP-2,3-diacylglucosamine hydrolase